MCVAAGLSMSRVDPVHATGSGGCSPSSNFMKHFKKYSPFTSMTTPRRSTVTFAVAEVQPLDNRLVAAQRRAQEAEAALRTASLERDVERLALEAASETNSRLRAERDAARAVAAQASGSRMEAEWLAIKAAQQLEDAHQELDEVAQRHAAELAALHEQLREAQKAKKKSSKARQTMLMVKQRLDAAGVSQPPPEVAHDLHAALQMAKAGEQWRASARSLIMSELRKLQA